MSAAPLVCSDCGTQGRRYRRGLCGHCALTEDLRAVLDDGQGGIRPELTPFFEGVRRMRNPRAGVNWISRPHVHAMLRTLADPSFPVTHETLDSMRPWRSVAYLRDLLMLHGVLPHADRHLMLFQRWLRDTLDGIGERESRQLVERFATWHVLHRLRRFADRGPVTEKQTQQARDEIRQAIAFLAWLRERGLLLAACRQAEVDAWYASAYTARRLTHAFLRWAMRNKLLARVTIPHQDTRNPAPLSQHHRLALIRRLVTDEDIPLLTRVVAILMLLYAQPLTRVLRLTVDDVLHENGEVSIRLGEPPTPVPEPFAGLLQQHIQQRLNLTTATNPDARWLFPGRRGGQPMTTDAVEHRLRQHGIRTLTGRTAALRQLVLQAPAPVVAKMLGYTLDHAARLATEAGGAWARYAPMTTPGDTGQRTRDS
ncbi:hypothetical protein MOQ72_27135 [Saccharopolyspora sp. K220]|uniref:tyrosine-type recombinase/integrase n=1 Tax=Saccharopolyspora soli TaxID=2926618 RepID=UPI001F593639|nr:hypothetical protein [Saccharopolyspora soli]MCI2421123.1 hypothetical protein [Saccharopolyspora soli]